MTNDVGIRVRPAYFAHAVWAGLLLLPFAAFLLYLSQTELPPGQCSGIGWGCELAGMDAVGIALLFYGIPLALVWLIGHAVIGLVQWRRSSVANRQSSSV